MFFFKMPYFLSRFVMLISGCVLLAISITIFISINMGLDPYGIFVIGISKIMNLSYGSTMFIANTLFFIISVIVYRPCLKLIGIGTLINMSLIGYIVDFLTKNINFSFFYNMNFFVKIFISLNALILFSIGACLYITSSLGIAPYELLTMSIISRSKNKFGFDIVRVCQDIICLFVGLILKSKVGINTVILGVLAGFTINFFNKIFKNKFIKSKW